MELLDRHGIRRRYTPIDSSNYKGVAERCLTMTLELAMASCLETLSLFDSVPLPPVEPLRVKSRINVSDALNIVARVGDKLETRSPHQTFHGIASFLRLLPLLSPSSTSYNGRCSRGKITGVRLTERW